MQDLINRVAKVHRLRRKWASRIGLGAYRVFDRDIPEHRCTVDWYDGYGVVIAYPSSHPKAEARQLGAEELREAAARGLSIPTERVFVKVRRPAARRGSQYERQSERGVSTVVEEAGLRFGVNLSDYADTGLFLDHRNTRAQVREESAGKRFLNLFCYTGSFTVAAAAGGARSTTSVDLSRTYLTWLEENLELNGLERGQNETVRADALRWLRARRIARTEPSFDLAVLDPPSFSTSKKMGSSFEMQRDHAALVAASLALLVPGGVLYFSTNFRGFEPEWSALELAAREIGAERPRSIEELTPASIPEDFRDRSVHRCFRIVAG